MVILTLYIVGGIHAALCLAGFRNVSTLRKPLLRSGYAAEFRDFAF